jgi:GNAT superfamily N-acetyltransferase
MQIVPYAEVPQKEGFVALLYLALRWYFDPLVFESRWRSDPRLRDGPAAFCALEKGVPVGFVGVMDVPTRTVDGEERVGGIWAVATHPGFARRGISTALLEKAHGYFKEKGVRLVFINTKRTFVAHGLYRKLGYEDVGRSDRYPMAYKVTGSALAGETGAFEMASEGRVADLFQRFTADRTGFVCRPPGFLDLQVKHGPLDSKLCLQTDSGYVLAAERDGSAEIWQMVALDVGAQCTLLNALSTKASVVMDRLVMDERLVRGYEKCRYSLTQGTYDALLVKRLSAEVSMAQLYGDSFYISYLDEP